MKVIKKLVIKNPFMLKPRAINKKSNPISNPFKLKPMMKSPVKLSSYHGRRTKQEWNVINKNPFGDKDRDGVRNMFDCKPLNKNKQGLFLPQEDYRLKELKSKLRNKIDNRSERDRATIYGRVADKLGEKKLRKIEQKLEQKRIQRRNRYAEVGITDPGEIRRHERMSDLEERGYNKTAAADMAYQESMEDKKWDKIKKDSSINWYEVAKEWESIGRGFNAVSKDKNIIPKAEYIDIDEDKDLVPDKYDSSIEVDESAQDLIDDEK